MCLKPLYKSYQSQDGLWRPAPQKRGCAFHLSSTSPSQQAPIPAPGNEGTTMKIFGTVNTFDVDQGRGSIKPETGGDNLPFEKSAFKWDIKANPPRPASACPMSSAATATASPSRRTSKRSNRPTELSDWGGSTNLLPLSFVRAAGADQLHPAPPPPRDDLGDILNCFFAQRARSVASCVKGFVMK